MLCNNLFLSRQIEIHTLQESASPIFRDISSDTMWLAQISHPWNSTEETPDLTGIPTHILLISEIEGTKREIEYLKGKIINNLQYEMYKRGQRYFK